ncbi:MAG: cytochrome c oxidase subunit II transmembrane domain-containing protein, partial [Candidatus Binatia bacterium]
MGTGFLQLIPDSASTMAYPVDVFFFFMVAVSAFFSVLIAGLIVFFALRYRENRPGALEESHPQAHPTHGSATLVLEVVWTAIPFAIAMVMFTWGTTLYFDFARPPADVLQ